MKFITIILALCISTSILISCKKDDDSGQGDNTSQGLITGIDKRECICCGGFWIEIDNDRLRFFYDDLPPNNLDLPNRTLPISVNIDWRLLGTDEACGDMMELIEVFSISKN